MIFAMVLGRETVEETGPAPQATTTLDTDRALD
jgi:hypothetical protein